MLIEIAKSYEKGANRIAEINRQQGYVVIEEKGRLWIDVVQHPSYVRDAEFKYLKSSLYVFKE